MTLYVTDLVIAHVLPCNKDANRFEDLTRLQYRFVLKARQCLETNNLPDRRSSTVVL